MPAMPLSYDEAVAQLTGPGGPYEMTEAEIHGQRLKVFRDTPPSLRHLFDLARGRSDQPFLVYEDERLSFGEWIAQVDALAATLVSHFNVSAGDRVAIGMRNYPEWVTSFAAVTSVGGVAVSLNAWWTQEELDFGLRDSGSRVLLADIERAERAAETLADTDLRGLVVRSEGRPLPEGCERWEEVVQAGAAMPEVEIDPHGDATILYTSGTTGRPKGAVSTHHAVLSALLAFGCQTSLRGLLQPAPESDTRAHPTAFVLAVPLFHVTGCVAVMLSTIAAGAKLVIMYKWNAERALELIERERITHFVGVPTMSWDLLESPEFAQRDTSSLVSVGGGGAPAPPELVRRIDRGFRNGAPGIGYGMTETNAYGPQNGGPDYLKRPKSCGRPVPIVEIKVADESGRALPVGEVGEICFRGPNLIRGYWNRPEATAETIVDGWLRSGDLGRLDEEGFLYVEDRAKDMVLRGGENVYCAEVEAAIYEHPAVYEAAVFGLPHQRLGEEVAALIYPKPGTDLDVDELSRHLRERLAAFKVPSVVDLAAEPLPRNPSGKILKRQIRDEMAASRG